MVFTILKKYIVIFVWRYVDSHFEAVMLTETTWRGAKHKTVGIRGLWSADLKRHLAHFCSSLKKRNPLFVATET